MTAPLTRTHIEDILGPVDDNTVVAIQATGASLKHLTDAKALVDGKTDIVGQGEQDLPGPVLQVVTLLRNA